MFLIMLGGCFYSFELCAWVGVYCGWMWVLGDVVFRDWGKLG